ncbi:MAG TPA: TadE family protein [Acidimicrobiales bacterium]|nr:TadE family protein [Acidimicrobiales bacterium]
MSTGEPMGQWRRAESARGSITVELVLLTPVIALFLLVTVAFGRYSLAREQVVGGARAAAGAAAVAGSAGQAQQAATAAALPVLESNHSCTDPIVTVDSGSFIPGAIVKVSVSCSVKFADLLVPGLPGATRIVAIQEAAIDQYRTIQP